MSESAELLVVNKKESYLKQMPRGHTTGASCVKDKCQCASDGVAQGEKWGLGESSCTGCHHQQVPCKGLEGGLGGGVGGPTDLHTGHSWMPLTSLLFWLSVYRPCRVLR